ncbi:hypothetical protein Tco_1349515, partial [Tanacetum coccineum]
MANAEQAPAMVSPVRTEDFDDDKAQVETKKKGKQDSPKPPPGSPPPGLEQLVPDQFWIAEECKYDIAAMYGI